ncbi:MAG: sugar-binding domain-containing protein [Phycisphaeraceae bacterium]
MRIRAILRMSAAAIALAATVSLGLTPTAGASRFGPLFMDVRAAAQETLAAAAERVDREHVGFGRRYQQALAPPMQQLQQTLADGDADDRQVLDAATTLRVAVGRYDQTQAMRAVAEQAMARAQAMAAAHAEGFVQRYQHALAAMADLPRDVLADDDATLDEVRDVTAKLEAGIGDYAQARDLSSSVADLVATQRRLAQHVGGTLPGVDEQTVAALAELAQELESRLADPDAELDAVQAVRDELDARFQTIGQRLEAEFREAVDRPSPAYPAGVDPHALEEVDVFALPDEGWKFRRDRARLGYHEGWHEGAFDDNDWRSGRINTAWASFLGENYVGAGWYRATIRVPELADHQVLGLHFDGVDESAWVWIDGQYAGQHNIGSAGWDQPFQLDVTDLVQPGREHQITVRAMNTGYAGGVWQPVRLRAFAQPSDDAAAPNDSPEPAQGAVP